VSVPIETLISRAQAVQGGADRRRPPFFRTRKVALLGATDSLPYAPWHDPSWTLAAHPCCRPQCKREPDWYFDLHRPECFRSERKPWNAKYHTWLTQLQTPIFMQEHWPDVPLSVRYPIERIEAEYRSSVTGQLYASNHCAYMFALAMAEGVEQIGLFGCQYAGSERGVQRESLIYWIGRFEQMGGRVVVPRARNTVMVQPLYGYASHDEKGDLLPAYRHKPMTAKAHTKAFVLHAPSDVPLAPLPAGQPVRTMEMAFA
jgi:hypothetical protein